LPDFRGFETLKPNQPEDSRKTVDRNYQISPGGWDGWYSFCFMLGHGSEG